MHHHKFSGEDPILLFDFLTPVMQEADILAEDIGLPHYGSAGGMSEGQLIVCPLHLLTNKAAQHYRSSSSNGRSGGMVTWPEAVQYLLRTYTTEQSIRETVEHFWNLRQASNEDEHAFSSRVGVATYRCGNVHMELEKVTIFINGLLPELRYVLSRFRREQSRHSLTFDRIVSYTRDEEDSYRARLPSRVNPIGSTSHSHQAVSPHPSRLSHVGSASNYT